MRITGYGNASVKIETGGEVFYFDPYNRDIVPTDETAQQRERREAAFREAERVFITHGHLDHLGSVTALYRDGTAKIYCTGVPARTLSKQGFPGERICPVSAGDRLEFGEVSVRLYHSRHCRFNAGEIKEILLHHHAFARFGRLLCLLRANFHYPAGRECLLYEISGDGKRLQLLGSAGLDPGTDYPVGADVLILPYQGRSDMSSYCMKIVERLKPKRVLLNHYDDAFPPLTCTEDVKPFIDRMEREFPQTGCKALAEAEPVEL